MSLSKPAAEPRTGAEGEEGEEKDIDQYERRRSFAGAPEPPEHLEGGGDRWQ